MRTRAQRIVQIVVPLAVAAAVLAAIPDTRAQESPEPKAAVDIYGFAMLDMGYQTGQNDPDWFDVVRPTKLPSFEDEFGKDGHFFAGVRQSRFGVKAFVPTSMGELKVIFEFELFGVGDDAGQTTFRLRHAWGELGQFGAGQTWSPFMDPDVFPNSVEYWGPTGMVFFRNVQLRWTPVQGDNVFMVALERPGASGDPGVFAGALALDDIDARFPFPDVSAQWRMNRDWGHFQAAGILRWMEWDDNNDDDLELSGDELGWGVNLSTNVKFGKDVLRASVVYGEGIENYMNDATVDVGIAVDPDDIPTTGDLGDIGEALPILGIVAFYDHTWNDKFTSSIGYSMIDIDNSVGQEDSAFAKGQYALANLLYYPVENVMMGPELQWGWRENHADGYTVDDFRIQFSAKYSFKHRVGGNK